MTDTADTAGKPSRKSSKLLLFLGPALALVGGGAGFYAVQTGLLFESTDKNVAEQIPGTAGGDATAMPDVAYVAIEPLVVSLAGQPSHLRFRAQLEVASGRAKEVEKMMPRVVDVLNTYLRALKPEDLTDSGSLIRLRAQMLRRVQIATGSGRVNDLLIMEFVLN